MGRYYAPHRGYRYRRFNVGLYIGAAFFGSRYWLDDPWRYRLPAAYGPYRWVRYFDDVLLIDTRDGYVVDVIHDFFW
ncbi:MAG: RcnB family protein [Pseudomonadota bacterium]